MAIDTKEKIITLFRKYGFEYRKAASKDNFLAFTFKSGFFHNAELISLSGENQKHIENEMEEAANELKQLGFATKKTFYNNVDDIEKNLFDGFFNVSNWKEKIKQEYQNHCTRTLNALPKEADNYTYIDVPYTKNDKQADIKIIDDIYLTFSSTF